MNTYIMSIKPGSLFSPFDLHGYMHQKTPPLAGAFAQKEPEDLGPKIGGIQEIEAVLAKARGGPNPPEASPMTVLGVFFPCILLTSGWWERRSKTKIAEVAWNDPVQAWLFRGFEEWAPSWDVSLETIEDPHPYLFGQLGVRDEAESLLLIISGEKAKATSTYIQEKGPAFPAVVSGVLTHRDHLEKPDKAMLARWGGLGRKFNYCLRVREDAKKDGVSPAPGDPSMPYSGYLWKCVIPKVWFSEQKTPQLNEVFFLWEHTELTKRGAIEYNLDSLERKTSYIQEKYGELILLQKSSILVPGQPRYPAKMFYDAIFSEGQLSSPTS